MQTANASVHITQDDADEYVLGILDPAARSRIALHIATCDECQALIDEATAITGQIGLAAPMQPAPPLLKRRVFREAGIAPQPAWRRALRYARPAAVAAAIVIAIGALAGVIALQSQVNNLKDDNSHLRSQLQTAATGADNGNALVAALLSPGSLMAPITSTSAGAAPAGRLIWNDQQQKCWLVFDKLPALPATETYQLWASSPDGAMWSLGTFTTSTTGVAQYTASVGQDISDYSAALVTVEKAGGSDAPTTPPKFRADLTAAESEYR